MDDSGSAVGGHGWGRWLCPAGGHSWDMGRFGSSQDACLPCFPEELGKLGFPTLLLSPSHTAAWEAACPPPPLAVSRLLSLSTLVLVPGEAKAQ